jgi:hypothetical protein
VQPSRGRGKGRTRILYWFRTPPGVRVGRAALDEDAIRLIESNNPELEFDWPRILKGQADPEVVAAPPPARERRPDRERQPSRPALDRRIPVTAAMNPATEQQVPPSVDDMQVESTVALREPMTAAQARLGFQGLVRLRARYGETMARITERVVEPDRQRQLKTMAERLNPDAWVTDADVSDGLESYERTYEELRGTIGTRRRNPRPEAGESE